MNKIFIITGPAGAGEDSVIEGLKKYFKIDRAITTTSRKKRLDEKNNVDYYFITEKEFRKKIASNEFIEWAEEDRGKLYGGTHAEIDKLSRSKNVAIWKIDYKGALKAKELLSNIIIIYLHILPKVVEKRLKQRGQTSEEFIKARVEYAKGWYDNEDKFDYKIENREGELEKTIEKAVTIIKKENNF